MQKGLLIVISGPSGVGKGTIRSLFMDDPRLNLAFSISMTTRKPRNGEQDGVHYHFTDKETFEQYIQENKFLEYSYFVGNYYGTLMEDVEALRNQGKNVILEIEVDGAFQVQDRCPDALSIFILPPSMEELERRIRMRNSESDDVIKERLAKAHEEMQKMSRYRYSVCNDDKQLASDIISMIILRHIEHNKTSILEN